MHWTPLHTLHAEDWHSPETTKLRDELNERIELLLKRRSLMSDHEDKTLASPVEDVDGASVFQADCPQHNRFEALQDELKLRQDLDPFYAAEQADRRAAFDAAIKARTATEEDVKRRLVEIGYLDPAEHGLGPGRFQPGYVFRHPDVIAAKAHLEAMRGQSEHRAENMRQWERVTDELERLRRRAVRAG